MFYFILFIIWVIALVLWVRYNKDKSIIFIIKSSKYCVLPKGHKMKTIHNEYYETIKEYKLKKGDNEIEVRRVY